MTTDQPLALHEQTQMMSFRLCDAGETLAGQRGNGYQRAYDGGLVVLTLAAIIGAIAWLQTWGPVPKIGVMLIIILAIGIGATIDRYGPSWWPTALWAQRHLNLRLTAKEARQLRFLLHDSKQVSGGAWEGCRWVRFLPTEAERRFALWRYAQSGVDALSLAPVLGLPEIALTQDSIEQAAALLGVESESASVLEAEFFRRFRVLDLSARDSMLFADQERKAARLATAYRALFGWH